MIRIGLTGGIGSGKTTVARIFESLDVPVYYSDPRAKALMNTDISIRESLVELFGQQAYCGGTLDRGYIASVVFADSDMLLRLNAIVHPAVMRDFEAWAAEQHSVYVIEESAILFESGFDKGVDRVISVVAPESLRIERVMCRDGMSADDVRRRIANQMPDHERIAKSDYIVVADDKELIIPQVIEIDRILRNEAQSK